MSIDARTLAVVPVNRRRADGTPITLTCEIPLKRCCGSVLLGEECACAADDVPAELIFWDLREVAA